jgi:hypothetical protein
MKTNCKLAPLLKLFLLQTHMQPKIQKTFESSHIQV